jgi:N utilization substance protein B
MTNKRKTRELALQVLFLWDAHGAADAPMAMQVAHDLSEDTVTRQRGIEMAQGAWDGRELADKWVERLAPQWPPRRQPGVDRSILRLAVWELTSTDTPPKVVIDEAIELAKIFSTENSPAFVNGVLDAALKEHRALTEGGGQ